MRSNPMILQPSKRVLLTLSGLVALSLLCTRPASAQKRAVTSRRDTAPIIQLRSRDDARMAVSTPRHTESFSAHSSGSWPGPNRSSGQVQLINDSRVQTTAASVPYPSYPTGPVISGFQRKRIRDYSWIYIEPLEPPEIKLHDIVTIIVDEKSEVIMNSVYNRQRRSVLKAELKEFIRLGETGNLAPAALNAPTIDAQLQGQLNSTGQLTDQEGIKYRIAATVVDVLPNGILQLEARKTIQTQDDVSEYTLTGELRAIDVAPDNTASSENIADLNIVKRQKGRVYDSTKRNWGYRLYDLLSPF